MKKRSSFYRTFGNSAIFVFILILSACAGKDDIQISVTGDENFPVIKVGNPGRQPVVFQPASSAIGSIGFADGDSIIWLTGKPASNATMGAGQCLCLGNRLGIQSHVEVDAPLHKIPVFIRKGAAIERGDLNQLYDESLTIAAKKPDVRQLEKNEGWR